MQACELFIHSVTSLHGHLSDALHVSCTTDSFTTEISKKTEESILYKVYYIV